MLEAHIETKPITAVGTRGASNLPYPVTKYRPTELPQRRIRQLAEKLREIYPAVMRFTGEANFDEISQRFAASQVLQTNSSNTFGAGFSTFLHDQAPACLMPYLPAVAALEWAIHLTRRAPDVASLPVTALDRFRSGKYRRIALVLHPSCHLVRSRYPVLDLYRFARPEAEPLEGVAAGPDGVRLFVQRISTRVAFRSLDPDEFHFLAALRAGRTVNAARPHQMFDTHRAIARLAATGALVGYAIRKSAVA